MKTPDKIAWLPNVTSSLITAKQTAQHSIASDFESLKECSRRHRNNAGEIEFLTICTNCLTLTKPTLLDYKTKQALLKKYGAADRVCIAETASCTKCEGDVRYVHFHAKCKFCFSITEVTTLDYPTKQQLLAKYGATDGVCNCVLSTDSCPECMTFSLVTNIDYMPMKNFLFVYKLNGISSHFKVEASNQGIAIASFKKIFPTGRILKITKL